MSFDPSQARDDHGMWSAVGEAARLASRDAKDISKSQQGSFFAKGHMRARDAHKRAMVEHDAAIQHIDARASKNDVHAVRAIDFHKQAISFHHQASQEHQSIITHLR